VNFAKVMKLIDAMNQEGVDYVTFGAVAINLLGIVRATTDADFFIKSNAENVERLKRALRRLWDDPHIEEISAEDLLGDYPSVRYGPPDESFTIDFLTRLGEMYSYDNVPGEIVRYEGVDARVATPAKLYEMKRTTVRPKDWGDALALKEKFNLE